MNLRAKEDAGLGGSQRDASTVFNLRDDRGRERACFVGLVYDSMSVGRLPSSGEMRVVGHDH